jgi:phosphoglycolate phosphatase-like HAD superfamily hydrolase
VTRPVEKSEASAKRQPVTGEARQGGDAVMVGDSTWDCEAAARAGIATVGVLTGGFSEEELRDAGAACVFERLEDLLSQLDQTPLSPVSQRSDG